MVTVAATPHNNCMQLAAHHKRCGHLHVLVSESIVSAVCFLKRFDIDMVVGDLYVNLVAYRYVQCSSRDMHSQRFKEPTIHVF